MLKTLSTTILLAVTLMLCVPAVAADQPDHLLVPADQPQEVVTGLIGDPALPERSTASAGAQYAPGENSNDKTTDHLKLPSGGAAGEDAAAGIRAG